MEENAETIAYSNYTFLGVQTQINFPLLTVGCSVPSSLHLFLVFFQRGQHQCDNHLISMCGADVERIHPGSSQLLTLSCAAPQSLSGTPCLLHKPDKDT